MNRNTLTDQEATEILDHLLEVLRILGWEEQADKFLQKFDSRIRKNKYRYPIVRTMATEFGELVSRKLFSTYRN